MPYIKAEDRVKFEAALNFIKKYPPETAGELNYLVTMILQAYKEHHGVKYATFNDMLGALEGSKLELYRRDIAPYEDKKVKENGDCY